MLFPASFHELKNLERDRGAIVEQINPGILVRHSQLAAGGLVICAV